MDNRYVVTASDQTITCVISELNITASVIWKDPDGATISDGTNFTVANGVANVTGEQTSILTIAKLISSFIKIVHPIYNDYKIIESTPYHLGLKVEKEYACDKNKEGKCK